jgi:L-aspartate oxidase
MLGNSYYSKTLSADVLIVGSGIAGLLNALLLLKEGASVVLVCKGELLDSNTAYAQGGVAASISQAHRFSFGDSAQIHLDDTVRSGAGLVDVEAARILINSGERLIDTLGDYGVNFDCAEPGRFAMALEGGHRFARVLHTHDATGASIAKALTKALLEEKAKDNKITILPESFCLNLINYEQVCLGAYIETPNETIRILAQHTILATGGLGQIFARTTNPYVATGDGIALAYRAGADLADLEFIQFHPTALDLEGAPPYLISEAVRGAGAILRDCHGEAFMKRFHPDGELATRDIVARAIHTVISEQKGRPVFLDLTGISKKEIQEHFPTILYTCGSYGLDLLKEPIPVSPAAHYSMGGIHADVVGRTSIERLYAIGECAATGLHGANRLASNSLLEAGVMALNLSDYLRTACFRSVTTSHDNAREPSALAPIAVPRDLAALKQTMYEKVGLLRSGPLLNEALRFLREQSGPGIPTDRAVVERANMAIVSELVCRSALLRKESRGSHFRNDYQALDDRAFGKRLCVSAHGFKWIYANAAAIKHAQYGYQELSKNTQYG